MREGLLWYRKKIAEDLDQEVRTAVAFFQEKFGCAPRICYVNTATLTEEKSINDGLRILPNARVIKDHLWLEMPED